MTILQDFKQMFVVGEQVMTQWPKGPFNDGVPVIRRVVERRSGAVALTYEGDDRPGWSQRSWLDWPKMRELSRDGDVFVYTYGDGYWIRYWKPVEGE